MPAQTDAQRRVAEVTTLNAIAQTLNRAADVRDSLEAALRHAVGLMGLTCSWVFLRDESGVFRLVARFGLPPAIEYPGPPWNDAYDCQEQCDAGKLTKAVTLMRCSRLRRAVGDKRGMFQHATVPITLGDETLGILNVATTEFGQFTPGTNPVAFHRCADGHGNHACAAQRPGAGAAGAGTDGIATAFAGIT